MNLIGSGVRRSSSSEAFAWNADGLNLASRTRPRIGEHSLSIIRGIAEQIGEAILHVRTGEELHRSEERYRAIVENQTQMICRFGKAGCLTFANRSFRQAFSLGEGEISGIRIRDLLPGMRFDDILALRLLPPEEAGIYEEELYIGEGERTRVHYWRHKPLFDARGSFMEYQSIGQDRTDEMRRRSEERANELYGMIGRMATHVAHELKTPLTAVKMNVDILLRDPDTGSAQRKSLAILDREVRRMQSIIRDILELARPAQLEYSTFHIVDLIEELRPAIDLRLQAAGVEFVNAAGEGPVFGDYDRLRSAFLNLVVNALEAAPAGGGVRVSTEEHGGGIARILVRDNGPGIASPDKIFSPFYTTKRGGTGLGLMIAKRIFEQHGWSLILRETSPRGTVFAVELPGRE